EEESLFVLRTLQMYTALAAFIAEHPDEMAVAQHPWAHFRGFDPRTERQHHAFAMYLILRQGKSPRLYPLALTPGGLDATEPVIPHVKPMTVTWEALGEPALPTREQVAGLLLASGV